MTIVDVTLVWWQGPCWCSACNHGWRTVIEIPEDEEMPYIPMECPKCSLMTGLAC